MKLWQLFSLSPASLVMSTMAPNVLVQPFITHVVRVWIASFSLSPSADTLHSWCLVSCSALAVLVPWSHWGWILARNTELETWSSCLAQLLSCLGHACQARQSPVNLLMESLFIYYGLHGSFTSSSTVVLQTVEEPLPSCCHVKITSLCLPIILSWPYVN